jgi:transcriptional regulator with XRE-family HTH domain
MPRKKQTRAAAALFARQRKKVGEFIRQRRRQLSLSQRDLVRALGYKSAVSISDVEIGRTRVPFRRMYQYADVLRIPRDEFIRFVVGELQGSPRLSMQPPRTPAARQQRRLSRLEQQLVDDFRRLPSRHRNRVRQEIRSLRSGTRR